MIFERDMLYNLVWSEPMWKLAPKYSISDVGLKKICMKMGIPTPERGYWSKLAAGHKVEKTPLPEFDKNFHIVSYDYSQEKTTHPVIEEPEKYQEELARVKDIKVQEKLSSRNPLIIAAKNAYDKKQLDRYGMVFAYAQDEPLYVRVTPASLDRALRIMDAVVRGLTAMKLPFGLDDDYWAKGAAATIGSEKVHFFIEEKIRHVDHVLTQKEKEDLRKHSWSPREKWDYMPTGILSLKITDHCDGVKKVWRDGKQKLEEQLTDFFKGILMAGEGLRIRAIKREEEKRRWEGERRNEEERKRQDQQEQVNQQNLDGQIESWTKSRQLKGMIEEAESLFAQNKHTEDETMRFEGWKNWAAAYAERMDPLNSELFRKKLQEDTD